ncbi:MAG: hypothetical protein K2X03_27680 [Bryobacteraceae bacterium]|nr:hypothetical protein [Bryobacteraceae bacterium]
MLSKDRLILEAALSELRRTTGLIGIVVQDAAEKGHRHRIVIRIGSGNEAQLFAAEIKPVDRFQTPALVKMQLADCGHTPLLIAPYITRETAEHCRAIHLPFLDTAGNVFLSNRGQYVYVVGQRRPASLKQDRFRAMNRAGLQITFALLCRRALMHATVREIARIASTSLGAVGPVLRDLEERGFIRAEPHNRTLVDPKRLLEEWVTHYPISLRPKLEAKRFEADPALLCGADLSKCSAYWGGEVAAERLTRYLKPASFTIYAHRPITDIVAACRLRASPIGKVEVLDVFWGFDPQSNHPDVVHPVLAYADLLATHDGRNIEAAKLIYEKQIEPTFDYGL